MLTRDLPLIPRSDDCANASTLRCVFSQFRGMCGIAFSQTAHHKPARRHTPVAIPATPTSRIVCLRRVPGWRNGPRLIQKIGFASRGSLTERANSRVVANPSAILRIRLDPDVIESAPERPAMPHSQMRASPGNRAALRPLSPLRTGLESFPSSGSSTQ